MVEEVASPADSAMFDGIKKDRLAKSHASQVFDLKVAPRMSECKRSWDSRNRLSKSQQGFRASKVESLLGGAINDSGAITRDQSIFFSADKKPYEHDEPTDSEIVTKLKEIQRKLHPEVLNGTDFSSYRQSRKRVDSRRLSATEKANRSLT